MGSGNLHPVVTADGVQVHPGALAGALFPTDRLKLFVVKRTDSSPTLILRQARNHRPFVRECVLTLAALQRRVLDPVVLRSANNLYVIFYARDPEGATRFIHWCAFDEPALANVQFLAS